MAFVETIKERICESNKKVSFSQKSSVETKSANQARKFDSMGQSFSVYKGEVIESALFQRVTRDCGGEIVREVSVRRLRKIGSDEWFSLLASVGNDIWNEDFKMASNEKAIEQGEKNNKMEEENTSGATVSYATNFAIVNPVEDAKKRKEAEAKSSAKRKKIITFVVVGIVAFAAYKMYKGK